jgi:hypothetical protein
VLISKVIYKLKHSDRVFSSIWNELLDRIPDRIAIRESFSLVPDARQSLNTFPLPLTLTMSPFFTIGIALLVYFVHLTQSVIVFPGDGVIPRPYVGSLPAVSERDLFQNSIPGELQSPYISETRPERNINATILTSSKPFLNESHGYHPTSDSFIRGAIEAWAQHQHLVVRPDEVWFTILTQMNFYMTAHANDPSVRELFVSHEGKQDMIVEDNSWEAVLAGFKFEIQKKVKTDWLLDWILPKFSTSTENDEMTANVLMMGLMQQYFNYYGTITCGIPSVTLLGTVDDWKRLADKLERLPAFGEFVLISKSDLVLAYVISPMFSTGLEYPALKLSQNVFVVYDTK